MSKQTDTNDFSKSLDRRWDEYIIAHQKAKEFHVMYTKKDGSMSKDVLDQRTLMCDEISIETTARSMLKAKALRSMPVVTVIETNELIEDYWGKK